METLTSNDEFVRWTALVMAILCASVFMPLVLINSLHIVVTVFAMCWLVLALFKSLVTFVFPKVEFNLMINGLSLISFFGTIISYVVIHLIM